MSEVTEHGKEIEEDDDGLDNLLLFLDCDNYESLTSRGLKPPCFGSSVADLVKGMAKGDVQCRVCAFREKCVEKLGDKIDVARQWPCLGSGGWSLGRDEGCEKIDCGQQLLCDKINKDSYHSREFDACGALSQKGRAFAKVIIESGGVSAEALQRARSSVNSVLDDVEALRKASLSEVDSPVVGVAASEPSVAKCASPIVLPSESHCVCSPEVDSVTRKDRERPSGVSWVVKDIPPFLLDNWGNSETLAELTADEDLLGFVLSYRNPDVIEGDRLDLRDLFVAASLELNHRGKVAPRFRDRTRLPFRELSAEDQTFGRDLQFIDLHWLSMHGSPAPVEPHGAIFPGDGGFDRDTAWKFASTKMKANLKCELLGLGRFEENCLSVLQTDELQRDWSHQYQKRGAIIRKVKDALLKPRCRRKDMSPEAAYDAVRALKMSASATEAHRLFLLMGHNIPFVGFNRMVHWLGSLGYGLGAH